MLRIVKHIILIGNNPRQLVLLQHYIHRIDPGIESYIIDICHVKELLARQPADMILIHITADMARLPYVRIIRQEPLADEVPVFVLEAPLAEGALQELLNSGDGMFRYNNQ